MTLMLERPSPNVRPSVSDINWKKIDWSKSDQRIANELGINKAHVNAARHILNMPQATHEKVEARRAFRAFLAGLKEDDAKKRVLTELIAQSGVDISPSAAYRVALNLKLRGKRQNTSRYDFFWGQINWQLPDSDLASIWGVARGNIQMKRKILVARRTTGVPRRPQWNRFELPNNERYQAAYDAEKRKRSKFRGARPS